MVFTKGRFVATPHWPNQHHFSHSDCSPCESLCHILVILTIFQTFSLLLYLSWWSILVIFDDTIVIFCFLFFFIFNFTGVESIYNKCRYSDCDVVNFFPIWWSNKCPSVRSFETLQSVVLLLREEEAHLSSLSPFTSSLQKSILRTCFIHLRFT